MAAFGAPNFLSIIDAYEAGSRQRERSRLQELAEQGRQLTGAALGGDQNALAQLGGVDADAYMKVKSFTAEQKAARLDELASGAMAADTPEKWAAFVQRAAAQGHRLDPGDTRESIIDQAMGWKEKLAQQNNDRNFNAQRGDSDRNYNLQLRNLEGDEAYRAQQIAFEEKKLAASNNGQKPPVGYRYTMDGSLEFIPGGPADPNKKVPSRAMRPNNDQSNAAGFYDRMAASNQTIGGLEKQGTDYWQNFARNYAPGGTAAYFMTPEFQQYDQAQRDFINAQLRKESGAAIGEAEFENARRQYFPQPGDSDKVIKQKARNRQIAIDAMKRTAGPALQMGEQQSAPAGGDYFDTDADIPEGATVEDDSGVRYQKVNGQLVPVQ